MEVKVYFILPEINVTKIMTWEYNVDDSTKGRYGMVLGIYLLTALVINLNIPSISLKKVEDL